MITFAKIDDIEFANVASLCYAPLDGAGNGLLFHGDKFWALIPYEDNATAETALRYVCAGQSFSTLSFGGYAATFPAVPDESLLKRLRERIRFKAVARVQVPFDTFLFTNVGIAGSSSVSVNSKGGTLAGAGLHNRGRVQVLSDGEYRDHSDGGTFFSAGSEHRNRQYETAMYDSADEVRLFTRSVYYGSGVIVRGPIPSETTAIAALGNSPGATTRAADYMWKKYGNPVAELHGSHLSCFEAVHLLNDGWSVVNPVDGEIRYPCGVVGTVSNWYTEANGGIAQRSVVSIPCGTLMQVGANSAQRTTPDTYNLAASAWQSGQFVFFEPDISGRVPVYLKEGTAIHELVQGGMPCIRATSGTAERGEIVSRAYDYNDTQMAKNAGESDADFEARRRAAEVANRTVGTMLRPHAIAAHRYGEQVSFLIDLLLTTRQKGKRYDLSSPIRFSGAWIARQTYKFTGTWYLDDAMGVVPSAVIETIQTPDLLDV